MPEDSDKPNPKPPRCSSTIVAAGLLLVALALVVLYTSRGAFMSPVALVVVAAIGVAALLLQIRLRPDLSQSATRSASLRGPLWINILGVIFAIAAVFADVLHLNRRLMSIVALLAVVLFAVSGIVVLSALRKKRV